jgi:hypothetical protein
VRAFEKRKVYGKIADKVDPRIKELAKEIAAKKVGLFFVF